MDSAKNPDCESVILSKSDLDVLKYPCYLEDKVISFYFNYLASRCASRDILLVSPLISMCLSNCNDSESFREFLDPLKLHEKKLVLFAINNCQFFLEDSEKETDKSYDEGNHWSLVVYSRDANMFVHHDSMEGVNHDHARKLYEAIKGHTGGSCCASKSSSKSLKGKGKMKKADHANANKTVSSSVAVFMEFEGTPQQTNGYDCGLYVLAIAKTVCDWYCSTSKKGGSWFSTLQEQVDASIETTMRSDILRLIERVQGPKT